METSKLEKIGNVQLFFLLKQLISSYDYTVKDIIKDSEIIEDSSFLDACESAGNVIGIDIEYPIDNNYLAATIKLNGKFDYTTSKPSKELLRPVASLYSYDFTENRTEYVLRTYRNTLTSYSPDLVKTTAESMESEGYMYYGDGHEVHVDFYDGETNDVSFDDLSIRKIK